MLTQAGTNASGGRTQIEPAPRQAGAGRIGKVAGGRYTPAQFTLIFKDCPMKRLTLALLAAVCLLAGCGQKGPLYLPGDDNAGNSRDRFEL